MLSEATVQMQKFQENLTILDRIIDCVNRNENQVSNEDYNALQTILEELKVSTQNAECFEKIESFEFDHISDIFQNLLQRSFIFTQTNRDVSKINLFNSQVHSLLLH
jgi:hypothetical protein